MKYAILLTSILLVLAACAQQPTTDETVYTIGGISPLTGDGAVYGLPLRAATDLAIQDVNAQWEGKRLEIIWEDGMCTGKNALSAAQKLVNLDGVKVIYGTICSGETLGAAPFTEQNQVIILSPSASSPDITHAGDFVFRDYPSDSAQMETLAGFIAGEGYGRVAILSENTDYAQAQRGLLLELFPDLGVNVVADEIVNSDVRDVRSEVAKMLAKDPDAIIILPQTIPIGGLFAKQIYESGFDAALLGNDIFGISDTLELYPKESEGAYAAIPAIPESAEYLRVVNESGCGLGLYCAAAYDGIFILAEALDACGEDTTCIRDTLYERTFDVPLTGQIDFDENGDVTGGFRMHQARSGEYVPLN